MASPADSVEVLLSSEAVVKQWSPEELEFPPGYEFATLNATTKMPFS